MVGIFLECLHEENHVKNMGIKYTNEHKRSIQYGLIVKR